MKTLLLIDANSLIHRAFHALPPLTDSDGKPSGALYGVSSTLLKLFKEEKPDYAAALFDRPEPTFRDEMYEDYKATRPKAKDELVSQIIEARELFPKFGIKVFEAPGFEADDLIAAMVAKFETNPDLKIVILTGDRDTLQLVSGEKVVVRAPKKGISDTIIYDEKKVAEDFGLLPKQLIDYKALVGDQSDNIKGVPGIGPKTARDLILRFGNLEEIFEKGASDEKIKEKILPFKKEAFLSKKLVKLAEAAPIDVKKIEELTSSPNVPELGDYFGKLGFESLKKRLFENSAGPETATKKEKMEKPKQKNLFQ